MASSNGSIFRVTGHLCGEFPHKGQWRTALVFSLIRAWINGWVNNGEAGDLKCHRANCDVIVMNHVHVVWNILEYYWWTLHNQCVVIAERIIHYLQKCFQSLTSSWDLKDYRGLPLWFNGIMISMENLCSKPYPTDMLYRGHLSWLLDFRRHQMETFFRVTGPLCGEFTDHWWIPLTKTSDAELWSFLWSPPEQTVA